MSGPIPKVLIFRGNIICYSFSLVHLDCVPGIFGIHVNESLIKTETVPLGPSITDVAALGGRGYQGFCDNSIKALLLKSVTMG